MNSLTRYEKKRIALYYWMAGRGYHRAMEAMDYAEQLHTGFRKDNVTPSFAHQIWIASFLRTLPLQPNSPIGQHFNSSSFVESAALPTSKEEKDKPHHLHRFILEEQVLTLAFLHDTPEDKGISCEELGQKFGSDIQDGTHRLTKKFRGEHVPKEIYFGALGESLGAALTKGVDRLHNLSSMTGVFTREKQQAYIQETRQWHLPMLKRARRRFPQYEAAFENIKQSLESRIQLIEAIHLAETHQIRSVS